MTEHENRHRANQSMRLNQIAREIDALAVKVREPGSDPEVASALWHLCAVHHRILRELADGTLEAPEEPARGTVKVRPLPRTSDPIWVQPGALDIVAAVHEYLDAPVFTDEITAVESPSAMRKAE